ncbi:hypothetical protein V2H45_22220 [Tumidithrix elongata RA019]|uniref:Uncharacterized protein n=1 Tax=Tumidithrix elongata BACA0141 TaxID=2716417 RepID=A0AAW9Q5L4_9CYAN|nr:hypothetical protein [Tumidithrix elongata RA019]
MTDSIKATRAIVQIGALAVDGFMLPDGDYRMSQAQAAGAIDEPPVYALRFLASNDSKAILGKGYTDYTPESVEVQNDGSGRGQTRINALPLELVAAYWLYRSHKGNKKAFALCWAILTESLERRFDNAFGVTRTEQEREDLLSGRVSQLQSDLERLGEAYALDDVARQERDRYYAQLLQHGITPDAVPQPDTLIE